MVHQRGSVERGRCTRHVSDAAVKVKLYVLDATLASYLISWAPERLKRPMESL